MKSDAKLIVCGLALFVGTWSTRAGDECRLSKLKPNPDCPPRSGEGRIGAEAFFKRFPDRELALVAQDLVPDNDFGTAKPGDTFGSSWIVAAKGEKVGLNHKSAPWAKAELICEAQGSGGKPMKLTPDHGCGCGGTSDLFWNIPASAPPGKHTVRVTWAWPEKTKQKLDLSYTVTIENPNYGKTEDAEIAKSKGQFGADKVVVLQQGREISGKPYDGCTDMSLTFGGYEGDATSMIYPRGRVLKMGFWNVNEAASHYCRGLIRFDLAPLEGKKVKQAWLKFSIRRNQKYLPNEMKSPMPVYAMSKEWKEGHKVHHVDERGLSPGMPNVFYQAYPVKWEKPLAGGSTDHGPEAAALEPENGANVLSGARADVTNIVKTWLEGGTPNHGFLIGKDMPEDLAKAHPGKNPEAFKKLYAHGLLPFYSKDEPDDADFRPRLIVILE